MNQDNSMSQDNSGDQVSPGFSVILDLDKNLMSAASLDLVMLLTDAMSLISPGNLHQLLARCRLRAVYLLQHFPSPSLSPEDARALQRLDHASLALQLDQVRGLAQDLTRSPSQNHSRNPRRVVQG